jgi:hypothetical protein
MALNFFWHSVVIDSVNKALKPMRLQLNDQTAENYHRTYMALLQAGAEKVTILPEESQKDFYLQKWNKPTYALLLKMRQMLNANHILLDMYFRFLRRYAITGDIPWEKYDPVGFLSSQKMQKRFPTEKNIFERTSETAVDAAKKTVGMIPWILLAAAGIAVYVITSNVKKTMA